MSEVKVEESKSHNMVGRELEIHVIKLTIGGVAPNNHFSFRLQANDFTSEEPTHGNLGSGKKP